MEDVWNLEDMEDVWDLEYIEDVWNAEVSRQRAKEYLPLWEGGAVPAAHKLFTCRVRSIII
ncbi:hypothetical protein Tdes44962_MAKER00588 [Teratosphaeria destructans]|uniref:Uncharacterized protein n=1 Tax=Teratosphaeria destructans TaxID=418781 RepID=A0A9W7SNX5_9PEZI|nr:hypothetical protein Tdes44962_MAKER00588 [Teratosphaeria destructans]